MSKKLLSWNVNGIRAVAKKGFLEIASELDADILCLQETRAFPEQIPAAVRDMQGYHSYFVAAERRGYSGVAIYSKEEPQDIRVGLGVPRFDIEGRVLIAEYPDFTLLNCYFPNGGSSEERLQYKLDFYEEVSCYAGGKKNLLICGDVNTAHKEIDLARPKENRKVTGFLPIECAWLDKLTEELGFVDTFRAFSAEGGQYSWWDQKTRARERNVGWRIDYFFAASELMPRVKDAFILPQVMGSDHCPVGIVLE
ncbi:MAG: exodeoxyribonuclease III [Clostridia bacterium]|nr:exodeoxyribonuclease III [Clostridia bacterium]